MQNKEHCCWSSISFSYTIDNFTSDIEPIFKKLNSERTHLYVMGDFNIDLLKADIHRPTHEYLELLYSYLMLPTIYKPTRITESTTTIIREG